MKSTTLQNNQNDIEIQRCPHDEKNPYTMIRNDLIRDNSISPNCRWLLIYLLSNNEEIWTVRISQVAKHVQGFIGRDAVYRIVNEGIQAGYIQRFEYFENNMKRYKYYISETPKFKKSLRCPEIQYTESQYPENQGRKEGTTQERTSLRKNIKNPPPLVPPKKAVPKKPSKDISLRSEEEDIVEIYKILNDTTLSANEKKRICRKYTEAEVERAVKIAKGQTVKNSYMGLLLNILSKPSQWDDSGDKTQPGADKASETKDRAIKMANKYNKKLKEAKEQVITVKKFSDNKQIKIDLTKVSIKNEQTLKEENSIHIIIGGYLTHIPLDSPYFEQDIKDAFAQLR